MSEPGLCCDECFAILAQKSTTVAKLWLDLCQANLRYGIFGLVTPDTTPSLLMLEQLGFITTTDTANQIIVRVNGLEQDDIGPFFCGGACER